MKWRPFATCSTHLLGHLGDSAVCPELGIYEAKGYQEMTRGPFFFRAKSYKIKAIWLYPQKSHERMGKDILKYTQIIQNVYYIYLDIPR